MQLNLHFMENDMNDPSPPVTTNPWKRRNEMIRRLLQTPPPRPKPMLAPVEASPPELQCHPIYLTAWVSRPSPEMIELAESNAARKLEPHLKLVPPEEP